MEFDQLKTFLVVSSLGSITKAANQLYLSRSSVTSRICELENELGVALFKREGNIIQITPEGNEYIAYIKKMVSIMENAQKQIKKNLEPTGVIKIATTSNFGTYVLTSWLSEFRALFPLIEFNITRDISRPIIDKILNASIDIGIIKGQTIHNSLKIYPLLCENIIPVISPNHPWAGTKKIPVQSLINKPIIVSDRFSSTWFSVENWFKNHNMQLNVVMDLDQVEPCKSMVMKGHGIAFLPYSTVQPELLEGKLGTFSLNPAFLKFRQTDLIINRHQSLPLYVNEFVDFMLKKSESNAEVLYGSESADYLSKISKTEKF